MTSLPVAEGYVPFRGYKTWYRIVGKDHGAPPLVCLHGGPGVGSDYLEPIEALAATGRRVVFYDQLGCGRSDQPHDPSLWTVELYLDELRTLRRELNLDHIHLLGHSWGGMLAMEYALTKPSGVASLIIADTPASMREWVDETKRLRADLPKEVQATLQRHEEAATTDSSEYEEATLEFYRRHLCRLDPYPDCLMRTFESLKRNPEVYFTMNGPSEFHVTGTLKDWDIRNHLPEIRLPTLVISGRYDEATPAIAETVVRGIPGAEWVLFENSSHMPHIEESERYLAVLGSFLSRVEAQTQTRAVAR